MGTTLLPRAGLPVAGGVGAFPIDPAKVPVARRGERLPDNVRRAMETHFKADFSTVDIHVGPAATALGAIAFTMGNSIWFAPGRYEPQSPRGWDLIGHELAHVVQQRQGRVANPLGAGVAIVRNPALEADADRHGQAAARLFANGPTHGPRGTPTPNQPMSGHSVQRKIGFEFEFGLPLSRFVTGEDKAPDKWRRKEGLNIYQQLVADTQDEPFKGKNRVRGHDTVVDRRSTDGWRVTADNTSKLGSHKANLEVVTIPFDTENWSPVTIDRRIRQAVTTMKAWIENIVRQQPAINRVRIASTQYVVGFPPEAWPIPQGYKRGKISTNAYVQINIGVPLPKIGALVTKAGDEGNKIRETELKAIALAQEIVVALVESSLAIERDRETLVGFFTLLFSAVLGARSISPKTLLKKLWSLLPKTGLHLWWNAAKGTLSDSCVWTQQRNAVESLIDKVILGKLEVKGSDPLLGQYKRSTLLAIAKESGIDLFSTIGEYTVRKYILEIMMGQGDILTRTALQHRASTGGGTSALDLDSGRGQALGVIEVRNIAGRWSLGEIEDQALQWARYAYELTGGDWAADWNRSVRERQTAQFHATKAEMLLGPDWASL